MTRAELRQLAVDRAAEAAALLAAGRWSGAYYLAGYAVECGLKACIARRVRAEDCPDKQSANESYTHDLTSLARTAQMAGPIRDRCQTDPTFKLHWATACEWTEAARYEQWSEVNARKLFVAVADAQHGVLPWVKTFW